MIPNMYKIAGELTPTVFHVTARALAMHALSIFGDHSDVMAVRQTGWAMLASGSVQEAQDLAAIAHSATLQAAHPVHALLRRMAHLLGSEQTRTADRGRPARDGRRRPGASAPGPRALAGASRSSAAPRRTRTSISRAAKRSTPFTPPAPEIVQEAMDKFAALTGRAYHLFDYVGAPDAERVIVLMCSGTDTAQETVEALVGRGEKVGVVRVHLYRPFSTDHFAKSLPATVKSIAVLDRTKEPGVGRRTALHRRGRRRHRSGDRQDRRRLPRFRRSSAGATAWPRRNSRPAWSKPSSTSWPSPPPRTTSRSGSTTTSPTPAWSTIRISRSESESTVRCIFWGVGSDGTVGANKNSIKIIGEETDNLRPGLFRLRLAQVRLGDHLLPALRPAADPRPVADPAGQLPGLPPVLLPGTVRRPDRASNPAGPSCSTASTSRRKSGITFRAKPRNRSSTRNCASTSSTPTRWRRIPGWAGGSTPSCRPASSPSPESSRASRRSSRSRKRSRRPTASAAKRWSRKTSKPWMQTLAHLNEVKLDGRKADSKICPPPGRSGCGARIRQEGARPDDRQRGRFAAGQRDAGGRHLPERHDPVGEAQHHPRDPGLGRGDLHPVRQVLAGLPARGDPPEGLRSRPAGQSPGFL